MMEEVSVFKTIYAEEVYSVPSPVMVVLGIPWKEVKAEHQQLLSKILQAVGLSLDAVRFIYQPHFDLSAWHEKPRRVIAFVPPPKGLSAYDVIQSGETSVIFSDPLEILNTDDAAKRKLWNSLKTLFSD